MTSVLEPVRTIRTAFTLGMDTAVVVTFRTVRLAGGGEGARRERQLLVSEKVEALATIVEAAQQVTFRRRPFIIAKTALQIGARMARENKSRLTRN